jgi:ABC-type dipeptide/oligopeptide/nickel transport system permease component
MMWNYIRFDFGESYFRSISVVDLVLEKMPVSITLGLWSTVIAYLVSIPLGIRKAVRDGSQFDTWTSARSSSSPMRSRGSCSRSCCSCCWRGGPTSRSSRCAA